MNKETKDFVFFNVSWVWSSSRYFQYFKDKGHSVDIVTEEECQEFCEKDEYNYKNIVVYIPWESHLQFIRPFIQRHPESYLVQHDDGDEYEIQYWFHQKHPNLIMKREYLDKTVLNTPAIVYPMHFPMYSIWDPVKYAEKKYDVAFVCGITNHKRTALIEKLKELNQGRLSHLKMFFDTHGCQVTGNASEMFRDVYNSTKIGIHYFGNSLDSTRIWEILSCQTALLMPKFQNKITEAHYMPFDHSSYEILADDFSDIEQKILGLLENDRWKEVAERGQKEFLANQNHDTCCEYYYNCITRHCNL